MEEPVLKATAQLLIYFVEETEDTINHPEWVYDLYGTLEKFLYPE